MCCQVSTEQWGENGVTVVTRVVLYGPVRRCRGVRETRLMAPHVLGCDGLNRLMVRTGTEGSEERGEHSQESDPNLAAWQESLDSSSKL